MAYEISIEHRTASVEVLNRAGDRTLIQVDDRKYDLDIVEVQKGAYSIIYNGHSYNVEIIPGENSKKYTVITFNKTFNVEVIDAESKYISNRNKGMEMEGSDQVASPMPGKVVKIPVNVGDEVSAGQTLIVVEAMKMQSEFKSPGEKIVQAILVKEGDTVDSHQVMIRLENRDSEQTC